MNFYFLLQLTTNTLNESKERNHKKYVELLNFDLKFFGSLQETIPTISRHLTVLVCPNVPKMNVVLPLVFPNFVPLQKVEQLIDSDT